MSDFQYNRAPITEAIVEFRSTTPVVEKKRQKAVKKFSKSYSHHRSVPHHDIQIQLNAGIEPRARETASTIQDHFTSDDMTQQLHISDTSFRVSQLAPYCGWTQFETRIKRDWMAWRKIVGSQPINFVGMRYINRIDIPITKSLVHYEDYLNIYPHLPDLLDPCLYHSSNVRVALNDIDSLLNLNSAMVDSPLPEHLSIVLDLDVVRQYQASPRDEDLFILINKARIKKNQIFEACITDNARELFNNCND